MTTLNDFKVDEKKVWFGDYWPEGVPKQIYEGDGIVIEALLEGFMRRADEGGFWDEDVCMAVFGPYIERVSFRALIEKAKRFGTFLYSIGIRKGDVVAIDLPNSINFVIAYLGSLYIGAIMAGINPTYKPMELMHALNITDSKVFVVMDALYSFV